MLTQHKDQVIEGKRFVYSHFGSDGNKNVEALMQWCPVLKQTGMLATGDSPFPVSLSKEISMMRLGAWISKLSVRLVITINMVESKYAHNSRHSGRAVSRAEDKSGSGEAFGEGIGSSKCGGRTSPKEVEERAAHHPTSRSIKVAGKA